MEDKQRVLQHKHTEKERKKKRDRGKPKEISRNGQEDNIRTGSK